jgi:Mg-chelatase subunit ChlD
MRTLQWTPLLMLCACAEMSARPSPPRHGGREGAGGSEMMEEVVVTSDADHPRRSRAPVTDDRALDEVRAGPRDAPAARPADPAPARDGTTTRAPSRPTAPPPPPPPPLREPERLAKESTSGRVETGFASSGGGASTPTPEAPPPPRGDAVAPREAGAVIERLGAAPAPERRAGPPTSPGVEAGASDDNLAFGAYLRFLEERGGYGLRHDVSQRVVVTVRDEAGRPLPDARVSLVDEGETLAARSTYADGRALLFPSEGRRVGQGARIRVRYQAEGKELLLASVRGHKVDVQLDLRRPDVKRVPLDVAFVLDTTGSMGDELAQLKATLEVIHFQITHQDPRPDVRFGMVLYRDVGDDYRVQHIPFTADLEAFQRALATVQAGGGGDYPEDVQEGLRATLRDLEWREAGVRVAFLVGDAPPHLDYEQRYTYVDAMQEAARRGIKLTTVGASGLDQVGEVVWRQLAQYTMSPFVFLTYGEKGDAEGTASSVSHHVGSNWVAESLDAIVVRMVKTELSHYAPRGAPARADYFTASRSLEVPADDVLEDLFSQCVKQLVDYAVVPIESGTPTVLLPLTAGRRIQGQQRLERRLSLGLARAAQFQLVERDGQPALLSALAQQLSERYDEDKVAEVGRLVPAQLAVLGQVDPPAGEGPYEVLVKLVRIETGEVLSLSLLKIDRALLM